MSKTYRGDNKERLKDRYKQEREERQNKRHIGKDEKPTRDKTDDRRVGDRYGSHG